MRSTPSETHPAGLRERYDVVVVGAGAAGVSAAIAAGSAGASTVLIESAPYVGGELVSGLPILSTRNARGEQIVGGPLNELLDGCAELGGYPGTLCDWRTMWGTCVDPEAMRLVVVEALARAGVTMLLSSTVEDVHCTSPGQVDAVTVRTRRGPVPLHGHAFVDASGDGALGEAAGARVERGNAHGGFQPVSLVFRMGGVNFDALLEFVRDNPDEFMLAENPAVGLDRAWCAVQAHASGLPYVALTAEASDTLMARAIDSGELYPTTGMWMWPTSLPRREIGFNTTRVAGVDAMDPVAMGDALATLTGQVKTAVAFVRKHLPGYADAYLAAAAPKIGVRETQRVVGEETLQTDHIIAGCKRADGVAKGGHHVDVHGAGTYQKRVAIEGGRSYDIPYGALVPARVENMLVCGRPVSSTRDANGSARVMGTCIATGHAAGAAAAMAAHTGASDVREVDVDALRATVVDGGGILDGTH